MLSNIASKCTSTDNDNVSTPRTLKVVTENYTLLAVLKATTVRLNNTTSWLLTLSSSGYNSKVINSAVTHEMRYNCQSVSTSVIKAMSFTEDDNRFTHEQSKAKINLISA